jgi:ABC-type sugar transport system substrate-binding protein
LVGCPWLKRLRRGGGKSRPRKKNGFKWEKAKREVTPHNPKSCQSGTPLIGVALPNTTNPYYVAMRQGFIDGAKELGFQVNVQIANDDNEAQLGQVQGFIQQGICALALNGVKSGPRQPRLRRPTKRVSRSLP